MEDGFEVVNLHGCASGVIPTPTIGTNGNWFVGNKDTDVAAKGETGEAGPQGLKGDQGEIGPAGPQGIQGIQGEKGEKGDQGIQGETGDQGEKGDQGIQGIQGLKGDQGIQGIQGEKGDQGEKGTDADVTELERLSGEIDAVNQSLLWKNFTVTTSTSGISLNQVFLSQYNKGLGLAMITGHFTPNTSSDVLVLSWTEENATPVYESRYNLSGQTLLRINTNTKALQLFTTVAFTEDVDYTITFRI